MANGLEIIEAGVSHRVRTRLAEVTDDPRWMLYGGLVVLNAFDIVTTAMVLDRGGDERNPFVQPIVDDIWQIGVLKALVLVVVATLLARCEGSRIAEVALAATTGWYLAVVSWNVAVLTVL